MLGKIEGRRRRGWQRLRWLDGIIHSMDMSLSKLVDSEEQGSLASCSLWGRRVGYDLATKQRGTTILIFKIIHLQVRNGARIQIQAVLTPEPVLTLI